MALPALAALALAVGLVEVEGAGECPSASQVAQRLRALLPDSAPDGARDRALLAVRGGELEVTLRGARGESLASRRIPATAPCGELAAAAAVMIAAWEAELHPGLSLNWPERDPVAPPATPSPRAPLVADAPGAAPVAPAVAVTASPASPAAPRALRWEVGAALLVSATEGAGAVGLGADASVGVGRDGPAGRLAIGGTSRRGTQLGSGDASWARAWLAAGGAWRFTRGRFLVDLHAEALAALLVVGGEGFAITREELDFDAGLGSGARGAVRLGPVALFLDVAGVAWLRGQRVAVGGVGETALPRWELVFALGAAWGRFRDFP